MGNRLQEANEALWQRVLERFATSNAVRNPNGHQKPSTRDGGIAGYVAFQDDMQPEQLNAFAGAGGYDLALSPTMTIAFVGGARNDRVGRAWEAIELLKAAIAQDVTLGGAVEHAQIQAPELVEAGGLDWLADGLEVQVRLLFNSPTLAG